MTSQEERGGQLELLPTEVPQARRALVHLADLTGFEHAAPDRELVEQIAKLGLLQPIVVAGSLQRRYNVVEGRRRAKAVKQLAAQGRWPTPTRVDAVIVEGVDGDGVMPAGMMLALHASRRPSPASELQAIERILAYGGEEAHTIKQIAAQTGMPVQTVRRRLRLRNLSSPLRAAFDHGEIPLSIAETAARLTPEQQKALVQLFAAGEPPTLSTIREIARQRTAAAAAELPGGLFTDREAQWQVTVRGHLRAALKAIPPLESDAGLGELIGHVLDALDGSDPSRASAGTLESCS